MKRLHGLIQILLALVIAIALTPAYFLSFVCGIIGWAADEICRCFTEDA